MGGAILHSGEYTTASIARLRAQWPADTELGALGWEPERDAFFLYQLDYQDHPGKNRQGSVAPAIAALLREYHPQRFQPGQPPFQILVNADDAPHLACLKQNTCPRRVTFGAPILNVGAAMRDAEMMPNMINLPFAPLLHCLEATHRAGKPNCPLFDTRDPTTTTTDDHKPLCNATEKNCNYQPFIYRPDVVGTDRSSTRRCTTFAS